MKQGARGIVFYLAIIIAIMLVIFFVSDARKTDTKYTYKAFEEDLNAGSVSSIVITQNSEVPTGVVVLTFKDASTKTLFVENVATVTEMLKEHNIEYSMKDVTRQSFFTATILPMLIMVVIMLVFISIISSRAGGGAGGGNVMSFGKSRAKVTSQQDNTTTFKDVAGLNEERAELEEVVDFLKDPQKYTRVGARIPKGILLVGPPGTGKTLLARAVSGEAGVPFFHISGSDFVEMFVGVGASRVRDLFNEAKKNAPCMIFIDEIDAVARRRGSGLGGGHDEREQTLNQILVEMDGFGVNEGIIVMAATNRVDILDPAILRPGRFDRKVFVGKPDVKGREEILKVHARNKPLAEDVNLETTARTTAGFSGADLENLLNEAAINAATAGRAYIKQEDIERAFVKIGIGEEKKSRVVSPKEKRITAYHESGHAILFHILPEVGPVHMVSIIPTGMAGGYTMPLPEKDEMFVSKQKMLQNIMVSFGGRIAEQLIMNDITTGASQDIKQATEIARDMVTKYGMSERLGPINYAGSDSDEVFIGRDWGQAKSYSESTQALIDEEVDNIMNKCYADAKAIIEENIDVLHRCAELLIAKEKITREEFEALFNRDGGPAPENVPEEPHTPDSGVTEPAAPAAPVAEAPAVPETPEVPKEPEKPLPKGNDVIPPEGPIDPYKPWNM
ncbi:MAG: ATP-dependent zinc metalloprotease FtsH [Lachnospiraceae bacterium]|nr:ATP-dependent zinc metalloprotease FtsH [Lachnospiraceae bacterium]MBR6350497.1 ATP-dependent zinc metalloprotease FtsH [Lachnospiraceae bacterium]